jgi:cytochrome o ubiquinol oxidase subunit 3
MSATDVLPQPHRRDVDPYRLQRGYGGTGRGGVYATGRGEGGPASKRVIVGYGFWIFLLSDIVMFSCFFAAHAVLQTATAGGPSGRDLFNPTRVAIETACLLASSFACGLSAVATEARNQLWTQVCLFITGVLGLAFLMLELQEFSSMIAAGAGPQRSAFLSSFFTVVGCHGLHVTAGLLWLGTMMAQVFVKGFRPNILRRLICFNLFWHALDIIWVALFTIVYLIGEGR